LLLVEHVLNDVGSLNKPNKKALNFNSGFSYLPPPSFFDMILFF
jgi:hypothetical protein